MVLPNELINIMDEAKNDVLTNSKGELILPMRRRIWEYFGAYEKIEELEYRCNVTTGLKRRLKLAELCVEKVLNIWYNVFPEDNRPLQNLKMANDYILNKISHEQLWKDINNFIGDIDIIAYDEKKVWLQL